MLFFFNDTATTEIYTLSLHDALPILRVSNSTEHTIEPANDFEIVDTQENVYRPVPIDTKVNPFVYKADPDRKSTRLNSSHANISYAVFCLKKKNDTVSHALHLRIGTV